MLQDTRIKYIFIKLSILDKCIGIRKPIVASMSTNHTKTYKLHTESRRKGKKWQEERNRHFWGTALSKVQFDHVLVERNMGLG